MKRTVIFAGILLFSGSGCSTMSNTGAGVAEGGIIGGLIGTVAGIASGHPMTGAAIGAGVGAAAGGAIGHAEDKREQKQAQAAQQWAAQNQMTVGDVISMTHQHVSDSIIIGQIDSTYTNFDLRPADITMLQQQGVSDRVILAMQARRTPPPGAYVVRPAGGVVVYQPPPPPVAVGIGFSSGGYYGPGCRRW